MFVENFMFINVIRATDVPQQYHYYVQPF